MKKIIFLILMTLSLAGCRVETSGNGYLDGFWHLERIDTITTGGVSDLSEQYLFWSVQHNLLAFQDKETDRQFFWRFSHDGDSLNLSEPFIDARRTDTPQDIPLEDVSLVQPFGANSLNEGYLVETLTSSSMVLRNNFLRLSFVKF